MKTEPKSTSAAPAGYSSRPAAQPSAGVVGQPAPAGGHGWRPRRPLPYLHPVITIDRTGALEQQRHRRRVLAAFSAGAVLGAGLVLGAML